MAPMRILFPLFLFIAGLGGVPLDAQTFDDRVADMEIVRQADLKVATIGERLAIANAALCRRTPFRTGLVLHDIRQYPPEDQQAARKAFGFEGPVAVEAVVPGSAADRAGILPGMTLVAMDGQRVEPMGGERLQQYDFARMEAVLDNIDRWSKDGVLELDMLYKGKARRIVLRGEKGCEARYQIVSGGVNARSDGRYVKINSAMYDYAQDDEELAALMAHELAHNVLEHRSRLDAVGINRGMFRFFGKNASRIRATEIEADRLSLYLLANAGYDPRRAIPFWDRLAGRTDAGFLSDTTYPRRQTRVRLLTEELAALEALKAATPPGEPLYPAFAKPPFAALD